METQKLPPAIVMHPVDSSQIAEIGHDEATNTLAIRFKSKKGVGSLYHYPNKTRDLFLQFRSAESLGVFFGANIKPFNDHIKIEEPKPDEVATAEGQ